MFDIFADGQETTLANDDLISMLAGSISGDEDALNGNDMAIDSFEDSFSERYTMNIDAEKLYTIGNTGATYYVNFNQTDNIFAWASIANKNIVAQANGKDYIIGTYSLENNLLTIEFSTKGFLPEQLVDISSEGDVLNFENVFIELNLSLDEGVYNGNYTYPIPLESDIFDVNVNIEGNDDPSGGGFGYENPVYLEDEWQDMIFVADSLTTNGNAATPTINEDKLGFSYNISKLQDSTGKYIVESQEIKYQTIGTDDIYKNNIVMKLSNTVNMVTDKGIQGTEPTFIGEEKEAEVEVESNWMGKTGVYNPEKKIITWTVEINGQCRNIKDIIVLDNIPTGLTYATNSVTLYQMTGEDTWSVVSTLGAVSESHSGTISGYTDATGGTAQYTLGLAGDSSYTTHAFTIDDTKITENEYEKIKITYETDIAESYFDSNLSSQFVNSASLLFNWYEYGKGPGPPITHVLPGVSKDVTASVNNILKEAVSYNKSTHEITWKITVNKHHRDYSNKLLTITDICENISGMTEGGTQKFVQDSLSQITVSDADGVEGTPVDFSVSPSLIAVGNDNATIEANYYYNSLNDYSSACPGANVIMSAGNKGFSIDFGNIAGKYTITYKADVLSDEIDELKENHTTADIVLSNTVKLNRDPYLGGAVDNQTEIAVTSTKKIVNYACVKQAKQGSGNGDYIDYTVLINQNGATLQGATLEDIMDSKLVLDVQSVELWRATINDTGVAVKVSKVEDVSLENENIRYTSGTNKLEVDVPASISEDTTPTYVLSYRAFIDIDQGTLNGRYYEMGNVGNSVNYNGINITNNSKRQKFY